ncbi:hypothetical protein H1D24_14760 [Streptomyces sp. PSKA28]|uniref:Uncharacterized protein n=1 Tax=Streptomyces himalayensis subsp. himalayensis TaxID=2756131 RepID=A0A7W0I950_9ACTN|nr:hypothetical protein [Streptomyces himalayensis]MBA2947027.1 hypothetical protein [Streptomyces himalayensis subsp. himalayensis]
MRTTRALAVSAAAVVALGLAAPSAVAGDEPNNGNGSRNGIGGDGPGGNGNRNGDGPGGNGDRNGGGPGGNGNRNGDGFGGNGNNGFDGNGFGNNGFGGNGNGFGPNGPGLGGNDKDNGLGGFPGNGFPGLGGNGFPGFPGNGLGGNGFPRFPGNGPGVGGAFGDDNDFGDNISVSPSVVRPGDHVTVTVRGVAGVVCQLAGSKVESGAFQTTWLRPSGGNTATASATIRRDARGPYGVSAKCGGQTFSDNENELVVFPTRNGFGGNGAGGDHGNNGVGGNGVGGDRDRDRGRGNNGLPGPVAGGLGGSLAGATATDTAIGGGLVAASAAIGGVFWLRRRAEKRG